MAGRRLEALALTEVEKSELTALAARPKTAQALAERTRIVLTCADGLENKAVGRQLDVHPQTVGKWRRRFPAQRMEGLRDEPRPGAPRTIEGERIEAVITSALESQPKVRRIGVRAAWRAKLALANGGAGVIPALPLFRASNLTAAERACSRSGGKRRTRRCIWRQRAGRSEMDARRVAKLAKLNLTGIMALWHERKMRPAAHFAPKPPTKDILAILSRSIRLRD
jgi:transposase-like protein